MDDTRLRSRNLGFELEALMFETDSRYCYYTTLKFDALDRIDDVYSAPSAEDREKDDRDLEYFEATFLIRENHFNRVKA